jgi:hypothetical protein
MREYFLTRMLYKYSITKNKMADFQYQPCITLDSAQRNREELKLMLMLKGTKNNCPPPPNPKLHDLNVEFLFGF